MQKLKGKTVLITGASRGIGAETAIAFAKENCRVIITFLDEIGAAEAVQKRALAEGAMSVEIVRLNVKDHRSIKDAINEVVLAFGGIDILINNAGVIRWKKFVAQTDDDIEDQIQTNLEGVIKLTKQALPYIRDSIVNIASGAGSHPVVDLSVYCATKYGLIGFTQVLALENAGLNIYTVSPTMTSTDMTDYHGMPAEKVAGVIVQTAEDGCGMESGSDIKVWQVIEEEYEATPWS